MNRLDQLAAEHCTPRQRIILHLTNTGWSTRRIAIVLGCHHSTIADQLNKTIAVMARAAHEPPQATKTDS